MLYTGELLRPDPLLYAEPTEPQSFNKYQYCLNNPLRYVDPDGHQTAVADALKQTGQGLQSTGNPYLVTAGRILIGVTAAIILLRDVDWEEVKHDVGKSGGATGCLAGVDCTGHAQSQGQEKQQSAEGQSTNYQPNPKHDAPKGDDRRGVSPQAKAGGSLYDSAVQVKAGQKVAVDQSAGKFVVYRTDANGQTHGYETTWKGLRNDQRAALQKAGLVTQRGKIIPQKEEQQ